MVSLHTIHSSSLPAVLDGPGGGGGSVLEVYMSKCVKEIVNFTMYAYVILKYSANVHTLHYTLHAICTTEEYVNTGRITSPQFNCNSGLRIM